MNVGEIHYYSHSSKPKCVFVENNEFPLICIDFWFKAGSVFEESPRSKSRKTWVIDETEDFDGV